MSEIGVDARESKALAFHPNSLDLPSNQSQMLNLNVARTKKQKNLVSRARALFVCVSTTITAAQFPLCFFSLSLVVFFFLLMSSSTETMSTTTKKWIKFDFRFRIAATVNGHRQRWIKDELMAKVARPKFRHFRFSFQCTHSAVAKLSEVTVTRKKEKKTTNL